MKPQAKQPEHVERAQFSKRVQAALVARGMPASPTELQRAFNARNPKLAVSVHAARKWLMGEAIPTQARLRELAAVLAVPPTWLRFGEAVAVKASKPLSAQEHMLIQHFRSLPAAQQMHVLELLQSVSELRGKR